MRVFSFPPYGLSLYNKPYRILPFVSASTSILLSLPPTQSAAKDFPDAMYNLAALHLTGTGAVHSLPKALKFLSLAVEQGHSSAMYLLGDWGGAGGVLWVTC